MGALVAGQPESGQFHHSPVVSGNETDARESISTVAARTSEIQGSQGAWEHLSSSGMPRFISFQGKKKVYEFSLLPKMLQPLTFHLDLGWAETPLQSFTMSMDLKCRFLASFPCRGRPSAVRHLSMHLRF